jgi:sulfur carrier protein
MKVTVNNNTQSLNDASCIESMVTQLKIEPKGIAIALNQTVISKSDWSQTVLQANDNITIIKATQGG